MSVLRPVLEPFFWALFLVTALEPVSRHPGPQNGESLDSRPNSYLRYLF